MIHIDFEIIRIYENRYYTHLSQKSPLRCVALLIPFIGNILVGIYDFVNRKYNDKEYMLTTVEKDGEALRFASEELQNDRDIILAAVKEN